MKIFTQEQMLPSEKTLNFIKQIAYTYRSVKLKDGTRATVCLN